MLRQLVSVDGRPPRAGDEPGCLDPKPVSTEPLAMLLSTRQREFAFTWRDTGRTAGRPSVTLDYKSLTPKPPDVTWAGPCVSIDLPGRTRGRVWVDRNTAEVLRLDEQLIGWVEIPLPRKQMRAGSAMAFVVERADSSIRYRPIAFHDPDEIVMLPESIESPAGDSQLRRAAAPHRAEIFELQALHHRRAHRRVARSANVHQPSWCLGRVRDSGCSGQCRAMRIVLSVDDLAFFDRVPETLHFTLEPASDCNGVACHGPGAPFKSPVPHLHAG